MKLKSLLFTASLFSLLLTLPTQGQQFPGLDKSPMDAAAYPRSYKVSDKLVKVVYSRPQLKGRELSSLAPAGEVWRTGANEAAEITFYQDLNFGGKEVKAGTYTLFTIPGEKEWTIILSSAQNVWGSYFYEQSEDVLRVQAPVQQTEEPVEAFSIVFEGEGDSFTLFMAWGTTLIALDMSK